MPSLRKILIAPVKSLRMAEVPRARIGKHGVEGDRAFVIVGEDGTIVTMRDTPPLASIVATLGEGGRLALAFPDGTRVEAPAPGGAAVEAKFSWNATFSGHRVAGPFADALSRFLGRPVTLAASDPGEGFDARPVSLCSEASLVALAAGCGVASIDPRRMRQSLLVDGVAPHEEETWIGRRLRVGRAVLDVERRDVRCRVVDVHPEKGEVDQETLKGIVRSRGLVDRKICFGVYANVAEPGDIAVGDAVEPE